MKGEIELYNISFLILKVNLHFKYTQKILSRRSVDQALTETNGRYFMLLRTSCSQYVQRHNV